MAFFGVGVKFNLSGRISYIKLGFRTNRNDNSNVAEWLPGVDDADIIYFGQDSVEWGVINGILQC